MEEKENENQRYQKEVNIFEKSWKWKLNNKRSHGKYGNWIKCK